MFSSFPHRHGDATGKRETRDETRGSTKTSISYEISSKFEILWTSSNRLECQKVPRLPRKTTWQPAWKHSKRTGFPASPIDTATPQENQRLETRHVDAEKPAFRARLPPIFTLCSFKIDVFLGVFLRTWKFATSKSMFRARLPSIFSTSYKMPRLPRNHLVATDAPLQCDLQKTRNTTRLKCCACHEKWRWTRPKCCACHENCNTSSENVAKVLRLPGKTTFDTFQNTSECHEVPRLPRETKQRHVSNGCERLRTVADGCERLRTVATTNATSSEHTLNPQTPRVKREPLLRIREKSGLLPLAFVTRHCSNPLPLPRLAQEGPAMSTGRKQNPVC